MSKQEKKNDIESMICLTSKPSHKISDIIGISLWPPSSPNLNPLDYHTWDVLENKTNAISHQNVGCLKLLLRRNRIKCLQNLF